MEIFRSLRLRDLQWHPRVTSTQYYSSLIREGDWSTNATCRVHPHVAQVVVDEWRVQNDATATMIGVPQEGALDSNFEMMEYEQDGEVGGGQDQDHEVDHTGRKSKRVPAYNSAYSQRMHHAIDGLLPRSSPLWKDYCIFQKEFFEEMQRRSITVSGVGASVRKRGIADSAQGRGKSQKQCAQSASVARVERDSGTWLTAGLTERRARDMLLKHGAKEGWIVEVYPDVDSKAYVPGARWFRLIVNGLVYGHEEYEQIKATRWFVDNSVTQLQDEYHIEPCDIRSVKAYGPKTAPMFSNLS
jgi:hypothetical protein